MAALRSADRGIHRAVDRLAKRFSLVNQWEPAREQNNSVSTRRKPEQQESTGGFSYGPIVDSPLRGKKSAPSDRPHPGVADHPFAAAQQPNLLNVAQIHGGSQACERIAHWNEFVRHVSFESCISDGPHDSIPLHLLGIV